MLHILYKTKPQSAFFLSGCTYRIINTRDSSGVRDLNQLQNDCSSTLLGLIKVIESSTGRFFSSLFLQLCLYMLRTKIPWIYITCFASNFTYSLNQSTVTVSVVCNPKFLMNNKIGFLLLSSSSGVDLIPLCKPQNYCRLLGFFQICFLF